MSAVFSEIKIALSTVVNKEGFAKEHKAEGSYKSTKQTWGVETGNHRAQAAGKLL